MATETPPDNSSPENPGVDCYECRSCGYIYEPAKGDSREAAPGTPFTELPADWVCPVCRAPASRFDNVGPVSSPSGFQENLGYGFGVNALTPGKKNLLIFAALGGLILLLLSFYGLN